MSSENQVVRKGDLVIKTFGSHLNYLKEAGIYEKLKGCSLAPEVTFAGSDSIEHVFVSGETLFDRMAAHYEDSELLEEDLQTFFLWYAAFRSKTGNSLEHLDLRKFIRTDAGLCYIDFEHCKASFLEGDLADAAAQLYVMKEPFSSRAHQVLCAFVRLAPQHVELNTGRFAAAFEKALLNACSAAGIEIPGEALEKELAILQ